MRIRERLWLIPNFFPLDILWILLSGEQRKGGGKKEYVRHKGTVIEKEYQHFFFKAGVSREELIEAALILICPAAAVAAELLRKSPLPLDSPLIKVGIVRLFRYPESNVEAFNYADEDLFSPHFPTNQNFKRKRSFFFFVLSCYPIARIS